MKSLIVMTVNICEGAVCGFVCVSMITDWGDMTELVHRLPSFLDLYVVTVVSTIGLFQPCINSLSTQELLICCSEPYILLQVQLLVEEQSGLEKSAALHQIVDQWWEITALTQFLLLNYGLSEWNETKLKFRFIMMNWRRMDLMHSRFWRAAVRLSGRLPAMSDSAWLIQKWAKWWSVV